MSTMRVTPPAVAAGPTLDEVLEEISNTGAGLTPIAALARDLGRDTRNMVRRARKMGLHTEMAYVLDPAGVRQEQVCVDAHGALVLRAWYAR